MNFNLIVDLVLEEIEFLHFLIHLFVRNMMNLFIYIFLKVVGFVEFCEANRRFGLKKYGY